MSELQTRRDPSQREKKKRRMSHLRNMIDVHLSPVLTTCTHTYTHTLTHSQTKTKDCIWWRIAQLMKNCSINAFYLLIASKLDLTLYHHWGKVLGEYFPPGLQSLPPYCWSYLWSMQIWSSSLRYASSPLNKEYQVCSIHRHFMNQSFFSESSARPQSN